MKFNVFGVVEVPFEITVEADSKETASQHVKDMRPTKLVQEWDEVRDGMVSVEHVREEKLAPEGGEHA